MSLFFRWLAQIVFASPKAVLMQWHEKSEIFLSPQGIPSKAEHPDEHDGSTVKWIPLTESVLVAFGLSPTVLIQKAVRIRSSS